MALNYTYTKYKDVYSITNNGVNILHYIVKRKEFSSDIIVKEGDILPSKTESNLINGYYDGIYSIELSENGIETFTIDNIKHYNNLLLSFINNAELFICGCKKCDECEDCNDCENYTNLITKALSFTILNEPIYTEYINHINTFMKTKISESILCSIIKNIINGSKDVVDTNKELSSLYYLAFYLYDLSKAVDTEEAEFIKTKYKSVKMIKCINKLGIEVDEIIDLFLSNMNVYYWQLDNHYHNIEDVYLNFNNAYLLDKPNDIFSNFERGRSISYDKIGRIAFAITNTDIIDFEVYDALGNDITDEFNMRAFPSLRTIIFVSEVPYSYSNVYFKFKKVLL